MCINSTNLIIQNLLQQLNEDQLLAIYNDHNPIEDQVYYIDDLNDEVSYRHMDATDVIRYVACHDVDEWHDYTNAKYFVISVYGYFFYYKSIEDAINIDNLADTIYDSVYYDDNYYTCDSDIIIEIIKKIDGYK